MFNERAKTKIIQKSIVGSLMLMTSVFADGTHVDVVNPLGEEQWELDGNRLYCSLSYNIPNYGVGYFKQYATKEPQFLLHTYFQVRKDVPALILANVPKWKPRGRQYMVAKAAIKPGEYSVQLNKAPTLKLLTFLSQGYQANINYRTEQGFTTTVNISPVHFQQGYAQYQKCLSKLLPFDYDDVKEITFNFGTDSNTVSDEDKAKLRMIAEYVAADSNVAEVSVTGYADDNGRKGYNNAVSEFRAKSIDKYLLTLGVPKKQLSVFWYGAQKPIARNDTEEGRAKNRRVVVKVIKK